MEVVPVVVGDELQSPSIQLLRLHARQSIAARIRSDALGRTSIKLRW